MGIRRVASKLLLECRIGRRSAPISWSAASRGQKPFAIGRWDDEDRDTVAGQPSSHAYLWPEVRNDKSLSAGRGRRACRGVWGRPGARAMAPVATDGPGSFLYRARGRVDSAHEPNRYDKWPDRQH